MEGEGKGEEELRSGFEGDDGVGGGPQISSIRRCRESRVWDWEDGMGLGFPEVLNPAISCAGVMSRSWPTIGPPSSSAARSGARVWVRKVWKDRRRVLVRDS